MFLAAFSAFCVAPAGNPGLNLLRLSCQVREQSRGGKQEPKAHLPLLQCRPRHPRLAEAAWPPLMSFLEHSDLAVSELSAY